MQVTSVGMIVFDVIAAELEKIAGSGEMVFNGSTVVMAIEGGMVLYDIESGEPSQFVLPLVDGTPARWLPYLSPEGTEVWVHNTETTALQRYKLP